MTKDEFKHLKVGDVVQLNSGGAKMTVDQIVDNLIYCICWNENIFEVVRVTNTGLAFALLKKV
jgi:uncharacterized protein YodC (DUF2158 family)